MKNYNEEEFTLNKKEESQEEERDQQREKNTHQNRKMKIQTVDGRTGQEEEREEGNRGKEMN